MGFNLMPVKSLNATHHGALPLSEEEVKNSVSFCAAGMSVKKKNLLGIFSDQSSQISNYFKQPTDKQTFSRKC